MRLQSCWLACLLGLLSLAGSVAGLGEDLAPQIITEGMAKGPGQFSLHVASRVGEFYRQEGNNFRVDSGFGGFTEKCDNVKMTVRTNSQY